MSDTAHAHTPEPATAALLPDGWRRVRLGELITEAQGGFASGARDNKGVIQLRMNNVTTSGRFDWASFIRVPATDEVAELYQLQAGDVLFNNTNSTELVGKSALFDGYDEPVVYSNHFTRLRTNSERLLPDFLALWLQEQWQKRTFAEICNKWIGQSAVQRDKLLALEIPLPPLPEQKRIAGVLTEQLRVVERARRAAEEQLDTIRALPAALLRAAFSGIEVVGGGGQRKRLIEVCLDGGQYGTSERATATQSTGLVVLGMSNLFQNSLRWDNVKYISLSESETSKYLLDEGDILFNRTNSAELVGKTAVFDGSREAVFASYLIRFRVNRELADPRYISAYINSADGRRYIEANMTRAIGQVNISASTMCAMTLPLPPLEEQQRIVTRLNEQMRRAEDARRAAAEQLVAINRLPAALLRKAFAGEV